jgi:hypothetical protein
MASARLVSFWLRQREQLVVMAPSHSWRSKKGFATSLHVVVGAEFDRGYLSPYFVTDSEKMICLSLMISRVRQSKDWLLIEQKASYKSAQSKDQSLERTDFMLSCASRPCSAAWNSCHNRRIWTSYGPSWRAWKMQACNYWLTQICYHRCRWKERWAWCQEANSTKSKWFV